MLTLVGRTALIIGATGYEGLGAVRALAEGGMNVVLSTLHGMETAQRLLDSDEKLRERCMIVRHTDGDESNLHEAKERFGSVDVIIPNHGGAFFHEAPEGITKESFLKEIDHQTYTNLHLIQCALPYLRDSAAGRIILMANAGARNGLPEEGLAQSAARGAVVSMTYSLARELAPCGITVNCIARAGMRGERNTEELLPLIPLRRAGTDTEFGAAVAYLASEEAGFLTGQILNLCGGLYMG